MDKFDLKILTISKDVNLAMDDQKLGDVQQRNVEYGKFVRAIHSVTYSSKKQNLPNKVLGDNVFIFPTNSINRIFFLWDSWKIASKICQQHKIDLVLTQDPFLSGLIGWLIKKKFKVKLLIHFHGDFWANKNWLKENFYNHILLVLSRFLVKQADSLRVVSLGIKNKLLQAGVPAEKIYVIPTAVDLEKFYLRADAEVGQLKKLWGEDNKIILFVGRLEQEKNLNWFLDVFGEVIKKYPSVVFVIVGAGSEDEKLKTKTRALNLTTAIKFVGAVNYLELKNYFQASNMFVLPSLSESFGKVLVEAGAAGLPAVASATTGAQEIIQDGENGFLVGIGDKKAMQEKILLLLQNEKLAEEMGQKARSMAEEKFNWRWQIEAVVKMWQEIVAG